MPFSGRPVSINVFHFLMYFNLTIPVHPLPDKKCDTRFFTTPLLTYFLFFSCFALYHAYSENEILDAHECTISHWVQHGQAALTFLAPLALFLSIISRKFTFRTQRFVQSNFFQYIPRGTPFKKNEAFCRELIKCPVYSVSRKGLE